MWLINCRNALLQLFYPSVCAGCGGELMQHTMPVCWGCSLQLPRTEFAGFSDNPIERIFYGRLAVAAAHSELFFSKNEIVQHLLHQLKYKGNQSIGVYLGCMMADTLFQSNRFSKIDVVLPVPLHSKKIKKRGYNQAAVVAKAIAEKWGIPCVENCLVKKEFTHTQTRKSRIERWDNVASSFSIEHPEKIKNKRILLIDDVITTGATTEACGAAILNVQGTSLFIASLAYASK